MPQAEFKASTIAVALMVRTLLVLHNCLATWRVVVSRDNAGFWGLAAGNLVTIAEAYYVVRRNGGNEWKWWCPCFLSYLVTTLPAIWLLTLAQYDKAIDGTTTSLVVAGPQNQALVQQTSTTTPSANITMSTVVSTINVTTESSKGVLDSLLSAQEETWIVIVQESLMYLLVFGRWMLPRGGVSRDALSDLLLEYLAMASDIMELYALFDEDVVRTNLNLTFGILTVWSISFFQFVPILVRKHKFRKIDNTRMKGITRACGAYFAEVTVTCMSIFLQDAPFFILRLYIIVGLRLTTYSLIFFVLKNIVTLLLLFYRLTILCIRLPCCFKEECEEIGIEDIDFSTPTTLDNKLPVVFKTSTANNSLNAQRFIYRDLNSFY